MQCTLVEQQKSQIFQTRQGCKTVTGSYKNFRLIFLNLCRRWLPLFKA